MADRFDLIVIGAGPGGYVAAIRAAQLGLKVACVDQRAFPGGTCLHVGCIPSKALLDSSEVYAQAKDHLGRHGVHVGDVKLDLKAMLGRKDKIVKGLTEGIGFLFKKNRITPVQGTARLTSPGRVEVQVPGGSVSSLEATAVLLATGSEAVALPALPFDGTHIVSSTEALCFDHVPEHLIVVGGGYIGLELGSVWLRLGAQVTVLEFLPRILAQGDAEIGRLLHRSLIKQGLAIHVETKVTGATVEGGQITVQAEARGEKGQFTGDKVLVAAGRRPLSSALGLEGAGVRLDARSGRVLTDENFQTAVKGVYAIGDLIAGPMLAHKAMEEGVAFAERLAGKAGHVNYASIPSVMYTWPELASVGLTEEQVIESGREYRVGKSTFAASGRARCLDETEGIVKVIADAKSDRVLGVHIFGPRASELIAEAVVAMEYAASSEDIARICHAHPTLSEVVHEAALAVDHRAIHA